MKDLTIIVPVYNVEKYIRACLESIFQQGLAENRFEIIIVNDGTQDRSMEMIDDIIQQHQNIRIINQDNQGLSVARNNGISAAEGKYILMPDSDDLLIENSLPVLLDKAIATHTDLLVADFLRMSDEEIDNKQVFPQKELEMREKTGEQLFLEDLNPYECYVWRTLYRKDFLINNSLEFVPGIYIQDVPFTHECYIKAEKCIRANWLMNIYRRGHESATFKFNMKKAKDFCIAITKTWELTHDNGLSPRVRHKLEEDVYISFSKMISIVVRDFEKKAERNEIVDFLKQLAPDIHFRNGAKQKSISFMFKHIPHLYIQMRHIYASCFEDVLRPIIRLRRPFQK
ncbi:MAG: glycosyltransferase [Prevotella sp.]|nr:glycosyltransferase [Prevotella sp.]